MAHLSAVNRGIGESSSPFPTLRFLVIDDDADGRFLLSQTLQRKFPRAAVAECGTEDEAYRILEHQPASVVVSHRISDQAGLALVRELRRRTSGILLLMVGAARCRPDAIAAGADAFVPYEEWLMLGNHVAALLSNSPAAAAVR